MNCPFHSDVMGCWVLNIMVSDYMAFMTQDGSPHNPVRMIALLVLSQVLALSTWFSASAVIPALAAERGLVVSDLSGLSTATQAGFVVGALLLAALGLADRDRPNLVFAAFAVLAGLANMVLPFAEPSGFVAYTSRFMVGAALAGVYPVGLKIAVSWSEKRRGLLASCLVASVAFGSSLPYLIDSGLLRVRFDADDLIWATTVMALSGAVLILPVRLGPFALPRQDFKILPTLNALKIPGIRRAYVGYIGHMWELYAFWGWGAVAVAVAARQGGIEDAETYGVTALFSAMALGVLACVPAGLMADRFGKLVVARWLLLSSGLCGVAAAWFFDGNIYVFTAVILLWGLVIIPDSPQFSALVGDHAPPGLSGSLLTLQTSLGFAITIITVQGTPVFADMFGWPATFLVLAAGPLIAAVLAGHRRT